MISNVNVAFFYDATKRIIECAMINRVQVKKGIYIDDVVSLPFQKS